MKRNVMNLLTQPIICQHKVDRLPDKNIFLHNHDGYEIYLFLIGESHFYVEENNISLTRGNLLLVPPYTFHGVDAYQCEQYERAYINIRTEYMQKLGTNSIDLSLCFSTQSGINLIQLTETEIIKFLGIIDELHESIENSDFAHTLYSDALLTQILILINRKATTHFIKTNSRMPAFIVETIQFINEHIDSSFTLNTVASQVHLNSNYLGRQFKIYTGISFREYIISKRISHTQMLLSDGMTPSEACYSSGFNDYTNFARTFSNYVGMSPRTFQTDILKKELPRKILEAP